MKLPGFLLDIWGFIDKITVFHTAKYEAFGFADMFLSFFMFSFIGWTVESIYCSIGEHRLINRGFVTGPICPIYGCGALIMCLTLTRFFDYPVVVILLGAVVCDTLEYLTSFIMEKLFHARWWDYSDNFLNIKGRICFKHTVYWAIFSAVYIYVVQPIHLNFIFLIPTAARRIALAVCLTLFAVDLFFTVFAAIDLLKIRNTLIRLKNGITDTAENIRFTADGKIDELRGGFDSAGAAAIERAVDAGRELDEIKQRFEESFSKRHSLRLNIGKSKSRFVTAVYKSGESAINEVKDLINDIVLSVKGDSY